MQNSRFTATGILSRLPILLWCAATLLSGQIAGTGNIQGTISDPTGAVVPNASVTLTNVSTLVAHKTTTDSAGVYVFPGIPVGTYTLAINAPGFKAYERTGV